MKILTISDSFKGSMSSIEVGEIVTKYYQAKGFIANYLPISDGGEGFLDVIKNIFKNNSACINESIIVKNANFGDVDAHYLIDTVTKTAYLELAEASGLTQIKEEERRTLYASTYGFGQIIKNVILKYQPAKIIIGLGGSATSDMGAGMLEAMGVEFIDSAGFLITKINNAKLMQIRKIRLGAFKRLIKKIEFITLTDVTNPLLGKNGAIPVFAPQKGIQEDDLMLMEKNFCHFKKMLQAYFKKPLNDFAGAGAAGGIGFTLKYLCNSQITSGIEEILKMINFEQLVKEYDVVITGEGCFDEQSLQGKVISGIMKYQPARMIIICGLRKLNNDTKAVNNFTDVYAIVPTVAKAEESLANPQECLIKLLDTIKL